MSYGQYSPNGKTRDDCLLSAAPASYVAQRRQTFGTHAQTAHVWAQNDVRYGRSNDGRVFFENGVIYSHGRHFAIAKITDSMWNGRRVILWNDATYSVSTSSHQSYARSAINYDESIVVPVQGFSRGCIDDENAKATLEYLARHEDSTPCMNRGYNENTFDDALAAFGSAFAPKLKLHIAANRVAFRERVRRADEASAKKDAADALARLKRQFPYAKPEQYHVAAPGDNVDLHKVEAEKAYQAESAISNIERNLTNARRARTAFKAAGLPRYQSRASAYVKYWQAKRAAWVTLATDLRNQEWRESDIADVKSYAALPLEKLANTGCILPLVYEKALRLEMPDEAAKILRAYQLNLYLGDVDSTFHELNPDAWDIIHKRNRAQTNGDKLTPEKWQAGAGNAYQSFGATFVRRKGERLETSQGAEAPWSHAVAIFLRAQRCRNESTSWRPNGERFRAGHFELDRIDASGGINIGCHRIEFEEMLRLAVKEVPQLVIARYPLPAIVA